MTHRTMHILAGSTAALLLAASVPLDAARAQSDQSGSTAPATTTTHQKLPSKTHMPPTTHMPNSAAAQDRELDQIGNKLLRETPKKPVNSTATEGGGLEPPTH